MTTPEVFESSLYPTEFDNNQNLFLAHDGLRVVLNEDYDPSSDSTKITVSGDTSKFPATGVITLTEQCGEVETRAISFYYTTVTATTFENLVALDGFDNTIVRPKKLTNVTQNVMADQHNNIKNAIIAIESFVGIRGTTDVEPFGDTMEGRINFLRKLVLTPRAWFTANKRLGLIPLEITFNNESFRLGEDTVQFIWDFGDQDSTVPISSLSIISTTSIVPISSTNVLVSDLDGKTITKTYTRAGNYTVSLRVINQYGEDSVEFEDFINARIEAPIEAVIDFSVTSEQTVTSGSPSGGPFDPETPPTIRSKTNKLIGMSVPDGINGSTLRTYAGEEVVGSTPIDPIDVYTWSLNDDLAHGNTNATNASYSIGGLYDLVLRCDTRFGAYRITTYLNAIDVIEQRNLWLFTKSSSTATSNEFGLISEVFKTGDNSYTILSNDAFLDGTNNSTQAKQEFNRNTGFTINGTTESGDHGNALIVYAGGGIAASALSSQVVRFLEFEGFGGVFTDNSLSLVRPWNWVFLPFSDKAYFLYGADPDANADENLSYQIKDILDLGGLGLEAPVDLTVDNYINGALELAEHITSSYDGGGEPLNGRFAVYRSAVQDSTGYILRNDGVGSFFKLKQFYRTEGTFLEPVENIRKLTDMSGNVKTEGQLVGLASGIFFFNNSGNIAAYNTVDQVWETGNSTAPFKNFQDITISDYADISNTLIATSDQGSIAYLSYDYTSNGFTKYNAVDQTFSLLGQRPTGEQWLMGIY